jgi:hypothetical protein
VLARRRSHLEAKLELGKHSEREPSWIEAEVSALTTALEVLEAHKSRTQEGDTQG